MFPPSNLLSLQKSGLHTGLDLLRIGSSIENDETRRSVTRSNITLVTLGGKVAKEKRSFPSEGFSQGPEIPPEGENDVFFPQTNRRKFSKNRSRPRFIVVDPVVNY